MKQYLDDYYGRYDEDGRLLSRHGRVEYLTTMQYIHQYLPVGSRILEVGAGTGRYSLALAREGYRVSAIELVQHNIDVFRSKLTDADTVTVEQGNALDLSRFVDDTFDGVLVLGPMYHLYTQADQLQALSEAKRVVRPDGLVMVAYCMNDPSVIFPCLSGDGQMLLDELSSGNLDASFHFRSAPEEIFALYRTEEIAELNQKAGLQREAFIASDLFTKYIQDFIDTWNDEVFEAYLRYHLTVCMRSDLIGASHHTLDILRKPVSD